MATLKKCGFELLEQSLVPMKTYTRFLDIVIIALLSMSIEFYFLDDPITDSVTNRRGKIHLTIISWQTLLFFASFCIFLRFIAQKMDTAQVNNNQ